MARLFFIILFIVPGISQELYSFVQHFNKGEITRIKEDHMWAFDVSGRVTENGMVATKTIKCLGYDEDNFLLLEETMIDLIATKKTLDKMSADYKTNSLIGVPYTLYIDTLSGTIDHVETDFKEFEELINSTVRGVGGLDNRVFPFGKNAVDIKINDKWSVPADSLEIYMGDEDVPNYMVMSAKYSLEKVKNKKGVEIAYITANYECFCNLNFTQDSKVFLGTMSGEIKNKIRWNLTNNYQILSKSSGSLKWEFSLEGETFSAIMELNNKTKRLK